jgi:hypothetical protein
MLLLGKELPFNGDAEVLSLDSLTFIEMHTQRSPILKMDFQHPGWSRDSCNIDDKLALILIRWTARFIFVLCRTTLNAVMQTATAVEEWGLLSTVWQPCRELGRTLSRSFPPGAKYDRRFRTFSSSACQVISQHIFLILP